MYLTYLFAIPICSLPGHKVLRMSYGNSPLYVVRQCVGACLNIFIQTTSSLKPLIGFLPNLTGMVPG